MAKKVLGGLDAMIGGAAPATAKAKTEAAEPGKRSPGRPRKYEEPGQLPEDEERASIIVKKDTWDKFKALGYWERRKQKTLLDEILCGYFAQWEKKHGAVKPVPADADR
jgi:hypothetical protein